MLVQRLYYIKTVFFGLRSVFDNCKEYLKKGIYVIADNYTLKNSISNNTVSVFSDYYNEKNPIKKVFNNLISKRKYVVSEKNDYNGELIVVSSSRKQYKIFDFDNKIVITKYKSKKQYFLCKSNYDYAKKIYRTSEIIKFDNQKLTTFERYLINNFNDKNNEIIYEKILFDYINNNTNYDTIKKSEITMPKKFKKYDILCKIYNNLIAENYIGFTKIKSHGDLWSSNIIYSHNNVYYIDFETINYYSFFYDIFFYMYSEAYLKGDYTLLFNYFNGKYDTIFIEYFKKFDSKYNPDKKNIYLLYFIYEYVCSKWKVLSDKKIKVEINKIMVLLEKLNIKLGCDYCENK